MGLSQLNIPSIIDTHHLCDYNVATKVIIMVSTIGIRELKNQATRIVREVRQEMAEYIITHRGKPVAVIRPFTEDDSIELHQAKVDSELEKLKSLASQVASTWNASKSAIDLVDEQRR